MIELERKALIGDKNAQKECTEKGIILSCPCCGGYAAVCYDISANEEEPYCCTCFDCGLSIYGKTEEIVIQKWNTRSEPPIGSCEECKHFKNMECTNELLSTDHEGGASYSLNFSTYDYCSFFEPKSN